MLVVGSDWTIPKHHRDRDAVAVVLLTPLIDNVYLILALITVSLTGLATAISLNIALNSDLLQHPQDSAEAMVIQVSSGNIFEIVSPIATGYIIAWTGGYDMAFVAGGLLLVLGAALTFTLTRSSIGDESDSAQLIAVVGAQ